MIVLFRVNNSRFLTLIDPYWRRAKWDKPIICAEDLEPDPFHPPRTATPRGIPAYTFGYDSVFVSYYSDTIFVVAECQPNGPFIGSPWKVYAEQLVITKLMFPRKDVLANNSLRKRYDRAIAHWSRRTKVTTGPNHKQRLHAALALNSQGEPICHYFCNQNQTLLRGHQDINHLYLYQISNDCRWSVWLRREPDCFWRASIRIDRHNKKSRKLSLCVKRLHDKGRRTSRRLRRLLRCLSSSSEDLTTIFLPWLHYLNCISMPSPTAV